MSQKPLLSVIMPVYNSEKYLETAVNSVLNQTFSDLELICVDDCSGDSSLEILKRISESDNRLRVIHLEKNGGAGNARNTGMREAAAEYITFADADDFIDPELYERAYACTENGVADEVVWGLTEEHFDRSDKHISSVKIAPENKKYEGKKAIAEAAVLLERDTLFGYQWNSLYKASVIKNNNVRFCDAIFYEDYFFNLDFAKHISTLVTLDCTGYHYYKRINGSITNRFSKDYFSLSYKRMETMFEFCTENGCMSEETYSVLGGRLLRYTLSALSRNNNSLSGMNGKEKKQWFRQICDMPLYSDLLPKTEGINIVFKALKWAILKKNCPAALAMGRIVYTLR